jgi:hypothetical protein
MSNCCSIFSFSFCSSVNQENLNQIGKNEKKRKKTLEMKGKGEMSRTLIGVAGCDGGWWLGEIGSVNRRFLGFGGGGGGGCGGFLLLFVITLHIRRRHFLCLSFVSICFQILNFENCSKQTNPPVV